MVACYLCLANMWRASPSVVCDVALDAVRCLAIFILARVLYKHAALATCECAPKSPCATPTLPTNADHSAGSSFGPDIAPGMYMLWFVASSVVHSCVVRLTYGRV